MPYQDIEDIAIVEPLRPPSSGKRLLRKIFVEDWGLKILAFTITLLLWLAVTDVNKPRTMRRAVQLNFLRPNNLSISNDAPHTVDVLLTGTREQLIGLTVLDLVATVDLSDDRAGERIVRLSADRVHMDLPQGVKIESFQPTAIPVRLEQQVTSQIPVEIKLQGHPAEGYEVYAMRAEPGAVKVQGPASLVEVLKKAPTETVSVEGRKESFSVSGVAIDIPDQKVNLVETSVDVVVEIGPRREGPPLKSSTTSEAGPMIATVTALLSFKLR